MTACKSCRESITFHKDQKSAKGKFIPLDKDTMKPHDCKKRYVVDCKNCNSSITFENDFKNDKTGKFIPINSFNGQPNDCRRSGLDEFFYS
jgi:hypothetical protein